MSMSEGKKILLIINSVCVWECVVKQGLYQTFPFSLTAHLKVHGYESLILKLKLPLVIWMSVATFRFNTSRWTFQRNTFVSWCLQPYGNFKPLLLIIIIVMNFKPDSYQSLQFCQECHVTLVHVASLTGRMDEGVENRPPLGQMHLSSNSRGWIPISFVALVLWMIAQVVCVCSKSSLNVRDSPRKPRK